MTYTLLLVWIRAHRGLVECAVILTILALTTWAVFAHERGIGAAQCVQKNTDERVAELVHDAADQARDAASINQEAKDYATAVSSGAYVLDHPVGVCRIATTANLVPTAGGAGSLGDGPTALPGRDSGSAHDVGRPLENIGRRADAQVAELQAYVRDVCRAGG